ncbi:hypothetical protein FJZ39_03520 [Candidatus Saccharibacteria bacterium]|nr:hypothetical protein [Candidatus Saccharibacteria bacterium]
MKKILVLWDRTDNQAYDYDDRIRVLGEKLGSEYTLSYAELRTLEYWIDDSGWKVLVGDGSRQDLATFNGVYFARWRSYQNALAAAVYLDAHGVPYKTTEVRRFPPTNKLGEHAFMAQASIPVPNTVITSVGRLRAQAELYLQKLGLPAVLKGVEASFGNDNFLVTSLDELIEKLGAYDPYDIFMLQSYVPNNEDYRVVVFNGEAQVGLKRMRQSNDTHLNNTDKGAVSNIVALSDRQKMLAERAAASMSRSDVAGVDLVSDSVTGKQYVLEVNKMPILFGATYRSEMISALAEFIKTIK